MGAYNHRMINQYSRNYKPPVTKDEMIAFEADIASEFNNGRIPHPVHLSGGNEDQLLKIFKEFQFGDFVFSTWRNHLHGLLAGIPPEEVKRQIMDGRSMTVCSPEHNFFASAIVGGCIPIALGVAWQLKRENKENRVWLFLGDMGAMTGMAYECSNYARWHGLNLYIVVEDNKKSVCTDTKSAWGSSYQNSPAKHLIANRDYEFTLPFPHAGAGKRVNF